jgi:hypothetical protein
MYFKIKNTLKSNHNHTIKYSHSLLFPKKTRRSEMIENNGQTFFTENTIYYKRGGEVEKNHNHEGNQKRKN